LNYQGVTVSQLCCKVEQGERNAKGKSFHLLCRAAAYFCFSCCKGNANRRQNKIKVGLIACFAEKTILRCLYSHVNCES